MAKKVTKTAKKKAKEIIDSGSNLTEGVTKAIVKEKIKTSRKKSTLERKTPTKEPKSRIKKKVADAEVIDFENDLDEFFKNKRQGLKVHTKPVSERQNVLYYFDTGNYAFNWAVSGDMINGGLPGAKSIDVAGDPECLDGDTEIEVLIPKKYLELFKND